MKEILNKLDKAFESKIRLGIMSVLMVNTSIDFNALKELLSATDGNLASHLKALEKQQYITYEKQFLDRKPNTRYSATKKGREAFSRHIQAIEQLLG